MRVPRLSRSTSRTRAKATRRRDSSRGSSRASCGRCSNGRPRNADACRPVSVDAAPKLSIIVTTYEWPEALHVLLRALADQNDGSFEVVVADDGSGPSTAAVVADWRERGLFPVEHVWQPDDGWRKSRILDLAALTARGRYLVFLDGDSVPRVRVLATLRRCMLPGWFVASKRLHLSRELTARVLADGVPVWRWSVARWLAAPRELLRTERESARLGLLVPV